MILRLLFWLMGWGRPAVDRPPAHVVIFEALDSRHSNPVGQGERPGDAKMRKVRRAS